MARGNIPLSRLLFVAVSIGIVAAYPQTGAVEAEVHLDVEPREGAIGDPLQTTLTVVLPAGAELEARTVGPTWGPFSVLDGDWNGPEARDDGRQTWVWRGRIAAFEIGELELPEITLRIRDAGTDESVRSDPVEISIVSVLDAASGDDLADLKDPASIRPNFVPLRVALALLALLLFAAALLWWLQRRYADRFAAVPVPDDPFHRLDPHVWVYRELQHLLEKRLAEQGQVDAFYAELSRILKLYLGGRFRVDLLEHTTDEIPELLRQAGAPRTATSEARTLFDECDRVKFARERPAATAWRQAVERVYSVVDTTRPAGANVADRGAA